MGRGVNPQKGIDHPNAQKWIRALTRVREGAAGSWIVVSRARPKRGAAVVDKEMATNGSDAFAILPYCSFLVVGQGQDPNRPVAYVLVVAFKAVNH